MLAQTIINILIATTLNWVYGRIIIFSGIQGLILTLVHYPNAQLCLLHCFMTHDNQIGPPLCIDEDPNDGRMM